MPRTQPSRPGSIRFQTEGAGLPSGISRLWAWPSRLRARRRAQGALQAAAAQLYGAVVEQARAPGFFREWGVPDTPEGRFEMIGLHAGLILLRLRREGAAGQALGQALFDLMFADVDEGLRTLGVGDLGVGRQVKRLAGQFYARLQALDGALHAGAAPQLQEALRANVWHGGRAPGAPEVAALADYLVRSERRLADQSAGALLRGEASFAGLGAGGPVVTPDR